MKTLAGLVLGAGMLLGTANAQISGYVKNSAGQGLEGKIVQTYITLANGNNMNWNDVTDAQGRFAADPWTTDVDDIQPDNYKIDAPYPNPFNPSTTITIPIETQGTYELLLVNILGEQIAKYEEELNRGMHTFKIIEPGTAGVYIYGITGEKGIITTGKIVYIGGGKTASEIIIHTGETNLPQTLNKTTDIANLDSIIIRGDAIQTKIFQYGGLGIGNGTYDAGTLTVDSAFININGKIIRLHQYEQLNNEVEGATITIKGQTATTNTQGEFNITTPTGPVDMKIEHPEYFTRETKIAKYENTQLTEFLTKTEDIPDDVYEFYNNITNRINILYENQTYRWINPPTFYIAVDTNTTEGMQKYLQQKSKIDTVLKELYKTPLYPEGFLKNSQIETGTNPPTPGTAGYYIIEWDPTIPALGLTGFYNNQETGEINSAFTIYENFDPTTIERITIKELSTGISGTQRYNGINGTFPSLWNISVAWENRNGGPWDKKMIEWQYSRPPGNKITDKDNGWIRF